jgi:hypothetical protein
MVSPVEAVIFRAVLGCLHIMSAAAAVVMMPAAAAAAADMAAVAAHMPPEAGEAQAFYLAIRPSPTDQA